MKLSNSNIDVCDYFEKFTYNRWLGVSTISSFSLNDELEIVQI